MWYAQLLRGEDKIGLCVLRVGDAGDCYFHPQRLGQPASEQVHPIVVRDRCQHVGLLNPSLAQHTQAAAGAFNHLCVELLGSSTHLDHIRLDQHYVVLFVRKPLRQLKTDITRTDDENAHCLNAGPFRRS